MKANFIVAPSLPGTNISGSCRKATGALILNVILAFSRSARKKGMPLFSDGGVQQDRPAPAD